MSIRTTPPAAAAAAAAAAEEACIFGYPLVLMDRMRAAMSAVEAPRAATMQAPLNQFVHAAAPEDENPDMLCSAAWLDVAEEPIVLSVPATHGRYYVVSMHDMWTGAFASVGPRTTGTGAGAFAIGGPGWNGGALPAGVLPLNAPTSFVRLAVQTHAGGDGGDVAARAVQAGFDLRPLNGRRRRRAAPAPGPAAGALPRDVARTQVDAMDGRTFLAELDRLVADHPPPSGQRPALDGARRLGLLGHAAGWDALPAGIREAAGAGVARALAAVAAAAGDLLEEAGGHWLICHPPESFGDDYRRRAAAAYSGFADMPSSEELCALVQTDAGGGSLSGRHKYVLRFAPDALPPARAFWSLSARARNDRGSGRYTVGNPDGLSLERDGSLAIHIQCDRPGSMSALNWLPTPPGGFDVVLRLFWPADEALHRRWSPPAVTRVG